MNFYKGFARSAEMFARLEAENPELVDELIKSLDKVYDFVSSLLNVMIKAGWLEDWGEEKKDLFKMLASIALIHTIDVMISAFDYSVKTRKDMERAIMLTLVSAFNEEFVDHLLTSIMRHDEWNELYEAYRQMIKKM